MTLPGGGGDRLGAQRTDRHVDGLLAGRDRRSDPSAASGADFATDPRIGRAARRLVAELVPVHPSFRFEERLAGTLAALARAAERPVLDRDLGDRRDPGEFGVLIPLHPAPAIDDLLADPFIADDGPRSLPRGLLIGGAITSAALSIAGAAFVAWRLTRAPGRPASPLARAARRAAARTAIGAG